MSRTTLRRPRRFHRCVLFAVALLLVLPQLSPAEQASQPAPPSAPQAQAPETEKQPADMMGAMMGTMIEANMKAFISFLGKPETAEKMAAFTKNYYDALVAPEVMEQLKILEQSGGMEDEGLAMMLSMVNAAYMQERASFLVRLNVLASPETGKQLASYSKNCFDALRENGFDREDAIRIVTLVGIPTVFKEMQ